jgi:hypothetical protein
VQRTISQSRAGHCDLQTDPNEAARPEKEYVMVKNFDEMQKLGQENADTAMKSFGVISNHMQTIATEMADYSKKSFEDGTKVFEQLLGTKSVEKVIELQQGYFKSAYEAFVAQATKIGGLYTDLAKETYKPLEGYVAKITPAK